MSIEIIRCFFVIYFSEHPSVLFRQDPNYLYYFL